mmetsp:Transcript_42090/g.108325  ORF Transcript_42090/g.108325 Transcript_42090/m.108325 type:complete len:116 (-) Transcript_42090:160-507(-)|eukprot:CAMPEP_0113879606 /NCGR_PEP_ID=MMETSP0780_2-20120614/7328_1 /TAXON_ID=652834 /ORGANISM="Palpitomonas bilix" /LENGTH=115 /DNA_ID=CAMNT_0000866199 /DNA_START=157 /DNA_END=504 /DNA_ORIENTATION=+ /assembly_acc=CAM_ASM_000599
MATKKKATEIDPNARQGVRLTIHRAEASMNIQKDVIDICCMAAKGKKTEKDMATFVKSVVEEKHPTGNDWMQGTWHCVCGKSFGASITHKSHALVYVQVDQTHFIVWKSKDSPFD